ncbi:hypothetical protein KCP77_15975 [Salmonella enterica subsp. enterica]|nr:hypothetical protein KCP77_15975 [Salmonella enterica subsp. enterica]
MLAPDPGNLARRRKRKQRLLMEAFVSEIKGTSNEPVSFTTDAMRKTMSPWKAGCLPAQRPPLQRASDICRRVRQCTRTSGAGQEGHFNPSDERPCDPRRKSVSGRVN